MPRWVQPHPIGPMMSQRPWVQADQLEDNVPAGLTALPSSPPPPTALQPVCFSDAVPARALFGAEPLSIVKGDSCELW